MALAQMDTLSQTEGRVAKAIESQTAKLPSDHVPVGRRRLHGDIGHAADDGQ